jgi:hypothetical protein
MMSAHLPSITWASLLLWSLIVGGIGLGIYRLRKWPAVLVLLAALFVTPVAGELLVSLYRPIFYERTLIWASIPLYLLFAAGIVPHLAPVPPLSARATHLLAPGEPTTRRTALKTLFTICLLAILNTLSLYNYYAHFQKEQWDDAAAYVARHVREGDLILYHASWTQLPFDFYFETNRAVTEHGLPVDLFDRGILEPKMTVSDLSRLHELIQGQDRIWLVYSHNWYTDPQNLIPAALADKTCLVNRRVFHGLEIHLYHMPSSGFDAPCPMLVYYNHGSVLHCPTDAKG